MKKILIIIMLMISCLFSEPSWCEAWDSAGTSSYITYPYDSLCVDWGMNSTYCEDYSFANSTSDTVRVEFTLSVIDNDLDSILIFHFIKNDKEAELKININEYWRLFGVEINK